MNLDCAEMLKLGVQFIGALIIARLAVYWALKRYKSEKMWERRLAVYADIVQALGEMRRIERIWYNEAEERREGSVEVDKKRRDRYGAARLRLEEVIALGRLLLPAKTMDALDRYEKGISSAPRFDHWEDALNHSLDLVESALVAVIEQGRSELNITSIDHGG